MAHEQMRDFLRFFASKRDVQLAEVDAIFDEFKETSITDDIIARDDLLPLLDRLLMEVKDSVGGALKQSAQMGGLVVEQVLIDGKNRGVNLTFDMSKTEDEALLAEVGKLRLQESNSKEAELAKSAFKLDSIRDEHHRLVEDTEKLQNENKTLKERNQQVMRQCTQTLGEKNKLAARVRELEEALASAGAGAASAAETSSDLARARAKLAEARTSNADLETSVSELSGQLQEARERLAKLGDTAAAPKGNFHQSKQFAQLKKLIQTKNEQLVELRKRLQAYEPDEVADADAASHK